MSSPLEYEFLEILVGDYIDLDPLKHCDKTSSRFFAPVGEYDLSSCSQLKLPHLAPPCFNKASLAPLNLYIPVISNPVSTRGAVPCTLDHLKSHFGLCEFILGLFFS